MRAERIVRLLPETYRAAAEPRHSVLRALLDVMESMQAPSENILDDLDRFVDPVRTPDRFVPMLASWLDLTPYLDQDTRPGASGQLYFAPGLYRLRLLVTLACRLNKARGTRAALEQFLTAATGFDSFVVEENPPDQEGRARPFHVRVRAPDAARVYADLISRIVSGERPAYVTYEIVYAPGATPAVATDSGAH
jgi:phage tail-like protein